MAKKKSKGPWITRTGRKTYHPRTGRKWEKGQPRIVTPLKQIYELGRIGCTHEEAAAVLGMSLSAFRDRLTEEPYLRAWENGQATGTLNLRRLQWRHAQQGGSSGVNMTIHMSKHRLREHDKHLNVNMTVDDVDKLIAELEGRMNGSNGRELSEVKTIESSSARGRSKE